MNTRIISVANTKGGVSKTSTGVFLATALAKNKGKKVLYLDCDSQASASQYRTFEKTRIYEDTPEPYRIRETDPTYIFDTIEDARGNYDIIFIDMPRLTRKEDDKKVAMILALCDSVLIPITSGELDNMSTTDFIEMVQRIAIKKKENGRSYQCAGFASMTGRVPTEDEAAREYMDNLKIPILKNKLSHLKRFSKPYTFESLIDIGKPERERFEPFFNEVVQFFNL